MVFLYYNEECSYTKEYDFSVESLEMLSLADLLLVENDLNQLLSFVWMDVWELNPEVGSR
jgi:hypothetical protein